MRRNTGYRLVLTPHGYELRWTEPGGHSRRTRLGTKDLQTAELRRAQIVQERSGQANVTGAELTVATVLSAYEKEHCPTITDGDNLRSAVLPRLWDHFGHLTPRQVTVDLCMAYKPIKLVGDGTMAAPTIRHHLAILRAAFGHAVKTRRLLQQDVPYIALPPAGKTRDRVITDDEHRKLLDAAAAQRTDNRMTRVERFLWIARYAPWRRRRIETLTWFAIDWERGIIDPRSAGERDTKKRVSVLPISDDLFPVLTMMHEQKINEWVLDSDRDIYNAFVRIVKLAGLDDGVTPHAYRHTWATDAVTSGKSIEEVARVLGNTPGMVRSTYAHLEPGYLRSAVNFRKRAVS